MGNLSEATCSSLAGRLKVELVFSANVIVIVKLGTWQRG
jgi:hypothetical protein